MYTEKITFVFLSGSVFLVFVKSSFFFLIVVLMKANFDCVVPPIFLIRHKRLERKRLINYKQIKLNFPTARKNSSNHFHSKSYHYHKKYKNIETTSTLPQQTFKTKIERVLSLFKQMWTDFAVATNKTRTLSEWT